MPTKSFVQDNQGRCCDAVLRVLETEWRANRRDVAFPEMEGDPCPIEVVCRIGGTRVALEHTRIEAYTDQLRDGVEFVTALEPIQDALRDKLPADSYFQLAVPTHSFRGLSKREIPQIRERITEWARAQAWSMDRDPNGYVSAELEGVPFGVALNAMKWPHPPGDGSLAGRIVVTRFAPRGLETLRATRIGTALDRKLPKLSGWSREATTVLALEENDIALTNHYLVAEALKKAASGRSDLPDRVYMITWLGEVVWLIPLWERGAFIEPYEMMSRRHEITTKALVDIFAKND